MRALLPECEKIGAEIIMIDNLSEDNSADFISQYPQVKLLINQQRQGFSANNNYGMAMAKGQYILLLNPDTEVQPNALAILVDFMNQNPQVGLCGAQLLFPDGRVQPSPRRFPTLGSTIARRTPLRALLKNSSLNKRHLMFDLNHNQPQAVDWLLGACLMIRREVLETVGPLDEGFFLYVEDIDWAKRIHQAGWQVFYVPTAQIVHHHIAVSDKRFLSRYMWLHFQSMLRYVRKHLLPPIPLISIGSNKFDIWQQFSR